MACAGTQLYTLRNVDEPFTAVLERVADAGFDGIEFAYRVPDEDSKTVTATLERIGLDVAGAHVPIDSLETNFEETVGFYEALGCDDIVIPYLDEEFFASKNGIERAVERLNVIADDLMDRNIDLHYHNHRHEFVDLDGETAFDAFIDASDVGIELDLGLTLLGGGDPVSLLQRLGNRVSLVHFRDVDIEAGESVPLGEGDLPLDRCAEIFQMNGGKWLIHEYEGEDPLQSHDDAAKTIRDLC